jgi:hypothetical protein
MRIPKLQKKIGAFLMGEEGKISKKKLMTTGLILSAAVGMILQTENASAWGPWCHDKGGHSSSSTGGSCVPAANKGYSHNNNVNESLEGGIVKVTHSHCGQYHHNSDDSGGSCLFNI